MMAAGRLPASFLVTHTFPLNQMEEAYDVFSRAADTGVLKVVLGEQPHDTVAVKAADQGKRRRMSDQTPSWMPSRTPAGAS
ncbi:hypothetical protein GCM10011579_001240 [Streptomyces albiflavescens]|uniref:Alcohol dehydrogenase n=1 Tax=Streptomyces albiflavescens TaxID=1623582 RepID=A0A917XQQ7_9ACTN|nr:hypothetical protein GCM10011579_001240 [Streptomyces albiflavescens]